MDGYGASTHHLTPKEAIINRVLHAIHTSVMKWTKTRIAEYSYDEKRASHNSTPPTPLRPTFGPVINRY